MDEQQNLKELIKTNRELIEQNSQILKKIRRQLVVGLWMRVLWYVILIGLPFALYFYVLEPYFELLGSSYQQFSDGIAEVPGWKQLNLMLEATFGGGEAPSDVQKNGFTPVE